MPDLAQQKKKTDPEEGRDKAPSRYLLRLEMADLMQQK